MWFHNVGYFERQYCLQCGQFLILIVLMFPEKLVEKQTAAYCKAAFLVTGLKKTEVEPMTLKDDLHAIKHVLTT